MGSGYGLRRRSGDVDAALPPTRTDYIETPPLVAVCVLRRSNGPGSSVAMRRLSLPRPGLSPTF